MRYRSTNWPVSVITINCNYILFTKLPCREASKGSFGSLSQPATCPYAGAPRAKRGPVVSSNIRHLWFCVVQNRRGKWHNFLRILMWSQKIKSSIFHKLICQCHFDGPYEAIRPSDRLPQARGSLSLFVGGPVHMWWRLHTVPLIAESQAEKLWIPIFLVFSLTLLGINHESTASVADAISTQPLIGLIWWL